MPDPASLGEYLERFRANERLFGHGVETGVAIPCPFCAAPDFLRYKVLEVREALEIGATCQACGRSARAQFVDSLAPSISFEIVQTGGPDQPAWLRPQMRRVS
jgi:hypothetical protein